ncbi:MAG: helix-turn-helix domain-containing protein, partial [Actinomycetota bacterium]
MAIEDDAERQAARELGQQIRRLRERKGWTAKALGHKAGDYDRSTISCLETGHGKCSLQLVQGCDDALGAGGELVKIYFELKEAQARRKEASRERAAKSWADRPSRPDGEGFSETLSFFANEIGEEEPWPQADGMMVWLSVVVNGRLVQMPLSLPRRNVLAGGVAALLAPLTRLLDAGEQERIGNVIAGRSRTDTQVVEHLETLLVQYRKLDDVMGSRRIQGSVRPLCGLVDHLCETAEPPVQQALLSVGAQCRQFNGWLYADGGNHEAAERCYDTAIARATAAGNQALAGYLLACRSNNALLQENLPTAIALAQEAQTGKWQATPAVRAWAGGQEARGWAFQDNLERCKRRLDESAELLAKSVGGDEPAWIYWFNEEYLTVTRGVCLMKSGDAESAIEILDRAIAALAPDRVRDRAYFLSWLAKAHARNDDPEQAGALARQAAQDAIGTGSDSALKNLRQLQGELQRW